MKKLKIDRKIIIIFFALILCIILVVIRFLMLKPKEVATIQTDKGTTVAIDELYLGYQLKMSQYIIQKENKLSTTKVDKSYWSTLDGGKSREYKLKNALLDSTKSQLIILKYASDKNISLDENDKKKVTELVDFHSSKEALNFIGQGDTVDKRILTKIFENLVLSDKTIKEGAKTMSLKKPLEKKLYKVVECDELIIDVKTGDGTSYEDANKAAKAMATKIHKNLNENSDLKKVAEKYSLGFKGKARLSLFAVADDDINLTSVKEAVSLNKNQVGKIQAYYEESTKVKASNSNSKDVAKKDKNKKETGLDTKQLPKSKEIKSYIIFKSINDDVVEESQKNYEELKKVQLENLFKDSLLKEVENTNFAINEELVNNLK